MKSRAALHWTAEEVATLYAHPGLTSKQLAEMIPGRTPGACQMKRMELGLSQKVIVQGPATSAEDAIIHANFSEGIARLRQLLPGRSEQWVYKRRCELGYVRRRGSPKQPVIYIKRQDEAPADAKRPEETVFVSPSGIRARRINGISIVDVPTLYGP